MRIGFITDLSENDFRFAAEHGFPVVEHNSGPDDIAVTKRRDDLVKWSKKYGVGFNMIGLFGRNFISSDAQERARHLADAQALIDLTSDLGAPVFVTGAGEEAGLSLEESCRRAVDNFGQLIERGRARGVRVALYNCHWCNFAYGPEAWQILLAKLPELGLKYDPSHAYYDGRDPLVELRDWGRRLYHFHAKGALRVDGKRLDDPPVGMDEIPWGRVMALLYYHNYQGDINIEPHSETWLGELRYAGILISQRHLKQFIA
jgi:sugar phosphate isomerase/epimerase